MTFLERIKNVFNTEAKKAMNVATEKVSGDKFEYQEYIKNETQLFRIRTNANNLRTALLMAENPYQRNRFELLRVYQNIDLDATTKGLINQRVLAIMSCDMLFVDENGETIELKIQDEPWFRKFIEYSHQSLFWGFSFIQIGDIIENKITNVELVPRVYCRPDFDLISTQQQGNGESVNIFDEPVSDWVVPIYRDKHDLGDYSYLSTFILMKMFNEINYAEYCEKYGTPFVIGKTDLQNRQTRDNLASMLSNFGNNAWAVVNSDDEINIMSSNSGATDYGKFLEYINEQLAISILGQTLTSQSQTGGTEQLGKIHNSVLGEIINSDIYFIETEISNKLIPILKKQNLIPQNVSGFVMKRKEEVDVKSILEQIKLLSDIGITVDRDWLSTKINIPFIENI